MYTVNLPVHVLVCALYGSFFFWFTSSYMPDDSSSQFRSVSSSTVTYNYERIDEVKKQCGFLLSSASDLNLEESKIYRIKRDLTFRNGDWKQDIGNAPLLPFHVTDKNPEGLLKMVSFWVTNVDRAHLARTNKFVRVSGTLRMDITSEDSYSDTMWRPNESDLRFQIWPGHTDLMILFQGIYIETRSERVMCLLGDTVLPSRDSESKDPWGWIESSDNQPPLLQDDQIMLTVRYPKNFSLTSRAIQGEMKSLNSKTNLKFFDKVHILSQLENSRRYEFISDRIVSKACDPYPYPYNDNIVNGVDKVYKGTGFCEILEQITNDRPFMVLPNWRCNTTDDDYCSKLGPFQSDKEIKATDGSFRNVKVYMQNVICTLNENASSATVAAVFRAVHPLENQYSAASRSGITNMTVFAEGVWKSSTGQLCMVGCVGLVDCNTRVCLYIPMSFSIKQHSIIVGTFYSIEKSNTSSSSYFPLSFQKLVQPTQLWNYLRTSLPVYTYSKLNAASNVLVKDEPFSFGTIVKKSLLRFPKLENAEELLSSLSYLSEDLTLHTPATDSEKVSTTTNVELEIISIGSLFGRSWPTRNSSISELESPYQTKPEYTEKQLLLNISAQLMLDEKIYSNISVVYLEGIYDQRVGKAYLVGCRDVRASWKVLFESKDLEDGLDCLIEVIVAYPSTTANWLINPTAKISIESQRTEDDPLYFRPIKLRTFPIMYRQQREDVVSRRGIEGILRILTLSFAITCISIQLFRVKRDPDSVPFVSLVMLGVQALGYSLPLITGAEALFNEKKASESYETSSPSYVLEKSQWVDLIDYAVKLLVMVSFLLTLRLFQKVWKSRVRLLSRAPLEPRRVPSDTRVLLATSIVHAIGYITVLIVHSTRPDRGLSGGSRKLRGWETELEEYIGLVQDFFLLPQVIGNFIWQIDCKPLQKLYYIGITIVRLVPHVYDRVTAPVSMPYFGESYEFVNPRFDFYSKFGDVAIPVVAILLVALVYGQQRWSYGKLVGILTFGKLKLLPVRSGVYERIPSKSSVEAELTSGVVNRSEEENDDERIMESRA